MHDRHEDHVMADLLEAQGHKLEAAELRKPDASVYTGSLRDWIAGNTPGERARAKGRELLTAKR